MNNFENEIVSKNNLITICPLINDKEFINDGFKIQAAHWMMQDRFTAASGTPVPKSASVTDYRWGNEKCKTQKNISYRFCTS